MAWGWLVDEWNAAVRGFLVAGLVQLALCAVLLAMDFSSRLHRAFGLVLFLSGAAVLLRVVEGHGWPDALARLAVYLATGGVFALGYVAACYHDHFSRRRIAHVALPVLLVAALAAELILLTRWPAWAFAGEPRTWFGLAMLLLDSVGVAVLAGLFIRDATSQQRSRTQSRQLMLAAIGLIFFPLAYGPHTLIEGLMVVPLRWQIVSLLAMLPAFYVIAMLWRLAFGAASARSPLRQTARTGLFVLAIPLATVAILATVHASVTLGPARITMLLFMTFWSTATNVILAYAIVRGEIFGAAAWLKWTIDRGTITAALLAVFFVVAQLAEAFIGRLFGGSQWVLGGVGAGLALFAIQPLQRFAASVAEAAMPGVKPVRRMSAPERTVAYREQLEAAWSDGAINAKERRMLEVARAALGVSHDEAARMEQAVLAGAADLAPRGRVKTPQTT